MCFSAAASFAAAGATGLVGAAAVGVARRPADLPLAAIPLVFAAQQAIEGVLWLELRGRAAGASSPALALGYLLIAEVFWPIYAPLAIAAAERARWRRRLMRVCLVAGAGVGAFLLQSIATGARSAAVDCGHVVYAGQGAQPWPVAAAYVTATTGPMLIASRRLLVALGAVVLAGYAAASFFFLAAMLSVWCFFAAVASMLVLAAVAGQRRFRGSEFGDSLPDSDAGRSSP